MPPSEIRVTGRGGTREVAIPGIVAASWSPDGRHLAIQTEVDGASDVRVLDGTTMTSIGVIGTDIDADGAGGRQRVRFAWAPDGRRVAIGVGGVVLIIDDGTAATCPHD